MLHLSPERLAALADDLPTPGEAEHLEGCAECAREQRAHRALLQMASADRDAIAAPLSDWSAIAGALAAERADTSSPLSLAARRRGGMRGRGWRVASQAAAAVVILGVGLVVGRRTAQAPAALPVASGDTAIAQGTDARTPAAQPVSNTPAESAADALVPEFRSVAEARAALTRYEIAYQNAAAYLAENDTTMRMNDSRAYRARLAALDRVGRAMREALREAPYDPVINGYYLTTIGQREATMRQLNTALPSGVRLTSF